MVNDAPHWANPTIYGNRNLTQIPWYPGIVFQHLEDLLGPKSELEPRCQKLTLAQKIRKKKYTPTPGRGTSMKGRGGGFQRRWELCGCRRLPIGAVLVSWAATRRQRAKRQAGKCCGGKRKGLDFGGCKLRIFRFSFSYIRLQKDVVLMLFLKKKFKSIESTGLSGSPNDRRFKRSDPSSIPIWSSF